MNASELRILLRVSDFDESVRFYQDLLGMECLKSWETAKGSGIILRASEGRTIELIGPRPVSDQPTNRLELWLQVNDVDGWYGRLQAGGAAIARELADDPWGTRSFGLADPDGVRIWLFEGMDIAQPERLPIRTGHGPVRDRRQHPRFKAPIYCYPVDLASPHEQAVDIGLGGTRIHSDEPLRPGEQLDVELLLPDGSRMAFAARVAWQAPLPDEAPARYDVGLQFLEVPPNVLQYLTRVLEQYGGCQAALAVYS